MIHYVVACELVFYCPTLWQDATDSSLRLRWDGGRDEGEIEESNRANGSQKDRTGKRLHECMEGLRVKGIQVMGPVEERDR
jgi:hypothetical protein